MMSSIVLTLDFCVCVQNEHLFTNGRNSGTVFLKKLDSRMTPSIPRLIPLNGEEVDGTVVMMSWSQQHAQIVHYTGTGNGTFLYSFNTMMGTHHTVMYTILYRV